MRKLLFIIALAGVCAGPLFAAPSVTPRRKSVQATTGVYQHAHCASAAIDPATTRTSANYALVAESLDAGGSAVLSSTNYIIKDASAGQVGTLAASTTYTGKGGYAGQLYEVLGLAVTGPAASVNESGTIQLGAAPLLNDNTLLAALSSSGVSWSVVSGPIVSVSMNGLATADIVYQNTLATVQASSGSLSGTGTLTVLNVNNDNYGSYAGDGIDDAWQAQYFGLNNPQAGPLVDADGTGQANLFKYLAGLNPLDPTSRFVLEVAEVAAQPTQRTLTFMPVYSGRTYTVQFSPSLTSPNWTALTNFTVSVNNGMETVTATNATTAPRFYRVLVSLP